MKSAGKCTACHGIAGGCPQCLPPPPQSSIKPAEGGPSALVWVGLATLLVIGAGLLLFLYEPHPCTPPDKKRQASKHLDGTISEEIHKLRQWIRLSGVIDSQSLDVARALLSRTNDPYLRARLKELLGDPFQARGLFRRSPSASARLHEAKHAALELLDPASVWNGTVDWSALAQALADLPGGAGTDARLRRGLQSLGWKSLDLAFDELREAAAEDGADDYLWDLAGRIALLAGRERDAGEPLKTALSLRPREERKLLLSLSLDDPGQATAMLESAMRADTGWLRRLDFQRIGPRGGPWVARILSMPDPEPDALLRAVAWMERYGRLEEQTAALRRAVQFVSNGDTWGKLAAHLAAAGSSDESLAALNRTVEFRELTLNERKLRASLLAQNGNWDKCREDLDLIVLQGAADPQVLALRSRARQMIADYAGALEDWIRAGLPGSEKGNRLQEAVLLRQNRRWDQAAEAFEAWFQAEQTPAGLYHMAVLELARGAWDRAVERADEFRKVWEKDPKLRVRGWLLRWTAMSFNGLPQSAREYLSRVSRDHDGWMAPLVRNLAADEALLEKGPADPAENCITLFYDGVRALAQGNPTMARTRWAWCRSTILGDLPEFELAGVFDDALAAGTLKPLQVEPKRPGTRPRADELWPRLATALSQRLEDPVRILFLILKSSSLAEQRRALALGLRRIVQPLPGAEIAVAEYRDTCDLIQGFSTAIEAADQALRKRPRRSSGTPRLALALSKAARGFPSTPSSRNVVLLTDSAAIAPEEIEPTIALLKENGVRVFVIGPEAPFGGMGRGEGQSAAESPGWEILQGGILCATEGGTPGTGTPASLSLQAGEKIGSGAGPWPLERICRATGGEYLFFEKRTGVLPEGYEPERVAQAEWNGRNLRHPLRKAVSEIAKEWFDQVEDGRGSVPSVRLSPGKLAEYHNQAHRLRAWILEALWRLEEAGAGRKSSAGFRWRANADLVEAQLRVAAWLLAEYVYVLNSSEFLKLKGEARVVSSAAPGAGIVFAGEPISRRPSSYARTVALEQLEEVVRMHPETPWARTAAWLREHLHPLVLVRE